MVTDLIIVITFYNTRTVVNRTKKYDAGD